MKMRDHIELTLLAALWGGSFLLMRVAVPEFGPLALIELRVSIAAGFLLVVLAARRGLGQLAPLAIPLTVVGVVNSALPFCLLSYATLSLTAGFASILNATSPLWGAVVAFLWLGERLRPSQVCGLAIGLAGVLLLVWGRVSFKPGGSALAIVAGLAASASYGVAASYTKRRLASVNPLVIATGSQVAASLVLAPLALLSWPRDAITAVGWCSVIAMGIASTGLAYVLYFRLISNVGPARAIAVTFLVPFFAILWGALVLHESLTARMVEGGLIVLAGTALSTRPLHRIGARRRAGLIALGACRGGPGLKPGRKPAPNSPPEPLA